MSGLMPLEKFDCERDPNNIGEQWKKWKRGLNIYLEAANIEEPKKKRATLLHLGGLALQDIFYSIPGAHEDSNKVDVYQVALRKLDEYFYLKQTQHTQSQNNIVTEQEPADDDSEWVQETVEEYFTQDEDSNDPEDSINHQGDPLQNIEVNRTIKLEEVDKPSSNESDSVDNVPTARAATRSRSEECPYPNEVKRKKFDNTKMPPGYSPTSEQMYALLDFLEANKGLALGSLRSVEGRQQARRLREEISGDLNAMGGCVKYIQQWQKVWTDKKYLTKKAALAAKASATGRGSSSAPCLTPIEKKVISIMGDGFAGPQTSARVPAFPNLSARSSSHAEDAAGTRLSEPSSPEVEVETEPAAHGRAAAVTSPAPVPASRQLQPRHRRRHLADDSFRSRLFRAEERRLEQCDRMLQLLKSISNNLININNTLINKFL